MGRLSGKTALITGGTSGIGFATAGAFAHEGARVLISGRSWDSVNRALAQLPDGTLGFPCDVASVSEIAALMAVAQRDLGAVDVLVLSAGVSAVSPLADVTEAEFDTVFGVNVKGVFFCVQLAAPLLNRGASVILLSSGAAEMGRVGRAFMPPPRPRSVNWRDRSRRNWSMWAHESTP